MRKIEAKQINEIIIKIDQAKDDLSKQVLIEQLINHLKGSKVSSAR